MSIADKSGLKVGTTTLGTHAAQRENRRMPRASVRAVAAAYRARCDVNCPHSCGLAPHGVLSRRCSYSAPAAAVRLPALRAKCVITPCTPAICGPRGLRRAPVLPAQFAWLRACTCADTRRCFCRARAVLEAEAVAPARVLVLPAWECRHSRSCRMCGGDRRVRRSQGGRVV